MNCGTITSDLFRKEDYVLKQIKSQYPLTPTLKVPQVSIIKLENTINYNNNKICPTNANGIFHQLSLVNHYSDSFINDIYPFEKKGDVLTRERTASKTTDDLPEYKNIWDSFLMKNNSPPIDKRKLVKSISTIDR